MRKSKYGKKIIFFLNKLKNNNLNNIIVDMNSFELYLKQCKCGYCYKQFTRKSTVKQHIEHSCKIKKELDNKKHEIFEQLKKDNEILSNDLDNLNTYAHKISSLLCK